MSEFNSTLGKVYEVDISDTDLYAEAVKNRQPNEKCWCGSNKQYKKCHRDRESKTPATMPEAMQLHERLFWSEQSCYFRHDNGNRCNKKTISSHTIQKKGPLKRITDASNHLMHIEHENLYVPYSPQRARNISWKKASTFPGFCHNHDTDIFSPIEQEEFVGSAKQCALHSYRSICSEIYKKNALIRCLEGFKNISDKGRPFIDQVASQYEINQNIEGQTVGLNDLKKMHDNMLGAINSDDYSSVSSATYFFEGDISIVSNSTIISEWGFDGTQLSDP
jgi:hypothetical protein